MSKLSWNYFDVIFCLSIIKSNSKVIRYFCLIFVQFIYSTFTVYFFYILVSVHSLVKQNPKKAKSESEKVKKNQKFKQLWYWPTQAVSEEAFAETGFNQNSQFEIHHTIATIVAHLNHVIAMLPIIKWSKWHSAPKSSRVSGIPFNKWIALCSVKNEIYNDVICEFCSQ